MARGLTVDTWTVSFEMAEEGVGGLPVDWAPSDVFFDGLPIVNWFEKHSHQLLLHHSNMKTIKERISFSRLLRFTIKEVEVQCAGVVLTLFCSHCWLRQRVQEALTLGLFRSYRRAFRDTGRRILEPRSDRSIRLEGNDAASQTFLKA